MSYSNHTKRNSQYLKFLEACRTQQAQVKDIIQLGYRLMRKARLHPHFFGNNTLLRTAEYLTFFSLKFPHEYQNTNYLHHTLSLQEAANIFHLFEKRIAERTPVEYLTNEATYLGFPFYVNENVLVPRSIMNTRFQEFLNETQWQNYRVLDLCTGSGCIGISLALLNPKLTVDLADLSPKALDVATINIAKHSLQSRVQCIETNLFSNIKHKYDLIITNPPYVSEKEYRATPLEFKQEPKMAFDGGKDGLDLLHPILSQAKHFLNPQGALIAEVGFTAAKRLKKQYRHIPFEWFKYRNPAGKVAWLAMDCAFRCAAKDL